MTIPEAAKILATELLGWEKCKDSPYSWQPLRGPMRSLSYLLSGDGMLEVLEAARKRGVIVYMNALSDGGYLAIIRRSNGQVSVREHAEALPYAVLLAVAKAIEATRDA